jgi:hypothetical protein
MNSLHRFSQHIEQSSRNDNSEPVNVIKPTIPTENNVGNLLYIIQIKKNQNIEFPTFGLPSPNRRQYS